MLPSSDRSLRFSLISHRDLCHLLQESELDSSRQPDSPFEEEPLTPRPATASQNPKYQLFLSNDLKTNGVSGKDADGPGGGGSLGESGPNRLSRWETNRLPVHRGSSESLASRDLDSAADRVGDVGAADSRHTLVAPRPLSFFLFFPVLFINDFKATCTITSGETNYHTVPPSGRRLVNPSWYIQVSLILCTIVVVVLQLSCCCVNAFFFFSFFSFFRD